MKKAILKTFIITILSVAASAILSGCSNSNDYEIFGSIHGCVTDQTDGTPLENASILLSPSGVTKLTDASGYFKFENLDAQQYTLTVQKQGYQPNRKTISAVAGEDLQVDIQLTPIPQ
ncbi:MAG: carboxypeptidase-like regulatory domain-containing protein [Muribaculaceae bacterium]|nr:carboxypeptidase-like regulatory domain-containing protein [Muribaculaceae bacterium]